tara:strand:+ start:87 stop:500 length:414 start_codon:yes stop_codon:yes gene_type:complete
MAIVTTGSKFLGVSGSVDTTEKRSANINDKTEYWTIEDIAQTAATDSALLTGTAGTLAYYGAAGTLDEVGEISFTANGAMTSTTSITASSFNVRALNTAPESATSSGTLGEMRIAGDFIFICTAINEWKRVAIATWG